MQTSSDLPSCLLLLVLVPPLLLAPLLLQLAATA
jgi:hypothetical protein